MYLQAPRAIFVAFALLLGCAQAEAHGIAGNRCFPGRLTFDDPAVADEAFLPTYSRLNHPTREGGDATDDAFTLTFLRLLTPRIGIGGDATWLRRARDEVMTRPSRPMTVPAAGLFGGSL